MSNQIEIKVINFEQYKVRPDVRINSWFRLSNHVFTDAVFFDFSTAELLSWIYILSLSSQNNSAKIIVNLDHALLYCRTDKKSFLSAVEKLKEKQIVTTPSSQTLRGRYVDVTSPIRLRALQDSIEHIQGLPSVKTDGECPLKLIWNENKGTLPIVKSLQDPKRLKAAKLRWAENPSEDYWREVISKLAASKFCTGQSGSGWRASFDFLIKPGIHIKIMEGQYDNVSNTKKKNNGMDLSL